MYLKKGTTYSVRPEILASDHFTTQTCKVTKSMGIEVNGRTIVKAGTIFPANDATAKGIIVTDVDVTEGDAPAAYMDHGAVYLERLPVAPDELALPVLKNIIFRSYK